MATTNAAATGSCNNKRNIRENPGTLGTAATETSSPSSRVQIQPTSILANAPCHIRNSLWFQRHHDSTLSVTTADDYQDPSPNDLNTWNGAALLCADCLGTGLLALPHNITVVLGSTFGLFFLILQLPINLYAGSILSHAALYVETKQMAANNASTATGTGSNPSNTTTSIANETTTTTTTTTTEQNHLLQSGRAAKPVAISSVLEPLEAKNYQAVSIVDEREVEDDNSLVEDDKGKDSRHLEHSHHDTATFDFIGMTNALFRNKTVTRWIMVLYYTNIFLVLGNYIVVMSHAVTALVGEDILCVPTAGVLASTLMFAVSQLRTMARLGRSASTVSLTALGIVVAQCLYSTKHTADEVLQVLPVNNTDNNENNGETINLLRKFSSMGSIGFAVGSQKLFLNIRHEFADRTKAPSSLAVALSAFGSFYVFIVLAAGKNPPGFLFDAIPSHTLQRRVAGFFLWVHVVVSYAINSQAICASMDRIFFCRWAPVQHWPDERRWMLLTGIMAATAFFVANAIPFFKDLVAFIGSLTSVPLTLLLPAIFHRRVQGVPIWLPTANSLASYALLIFSSIFMVTATLGSVYSILSDWQHHSGGFFSCH
ncbi:transmembrane amino acid transporter [Nitzschia inconspicua]|uniref:Transmembrane amino acid transporter n=1 Tax=Nitzschia inconspicua TaxID=303405 RepID=A0A9K3LLJ6_9STRA|nr:transmembrane amino acid transporter [Nitzschia inconspicua]